MSAKQECGVSSDKGRIVRKGKWVKGDEENAKKSHEKEAWMLGDPDWGVGRGVLVPGHMAHRPRREKVEC